MVVVVSNYSKQTVMALLEMRPFCKKDTFLASHTQLTLDVVSLSKFCNQVKYKSFEVQFLHLRLWLRYRAVLTISTFCKANAICFTKIRLFACLRLAKTHAVSVLELQVPIIENFKHHVEAS